ncbi:MAG: PA2779 family protein [Gammaproteobacteria bacterium]|nr:PA2779 family protein [Gammaproteobacteria bacterium]
MLTVNSKRMAVFLTGLTFLFTSLTGGVNAAMVGTETAVGSGERTARIAEIQSWIMQGGVQDQLVAMGVDPAHAADRVAGMTGEELRVLHDQIEDLPAGAGALEVIGVVFVVLLILEFVGITDIFAHF